MFLGHFGVAFAATYYALRRNLRNALWLAALVVSHWVLDWIVHRPDLPLYPGEATRHGLGLWNSLPATLAIEAAIFAAGIYIYLTRSRPRDRVGYVGFWALVALAGTSLFGLVLVAWGAWVDRHRMPAGSVS